MTINQLDSYVFLFNFESKADRDWVIANKLWNFDRALLVLKAMDSRDDPGHDEFYFTHFWLQIHPLPVFAMTKSIG